MNGNWFAALGNGLSTHYVWLVPLDSTFIPTTGGRWELVLEQCDPLVTLFEQSSALAVEHKITLGSRGT